MFVPVSKPLIDESDVEAVAKTVRDTNVSGRGGAELKEFEESFAKFCDCKYGISVSSGNAALHLAAVALGIGPGDEVLVSSFTNMSTFFSLLYTGAKTIPIDSESRTLNIDPKLIEAKITPKTKAISVVHIYGHPVDMDPIMEIAKKHKLFVIEDAAEAHGAEYKGRKVGSIGDIGCFSLLANKMITTGEGGIVTTNNAELAEKIKMYRGLAFGKDNKFMHQDIGFNYFMTNMQAGLGLSQLKKLPAIIERKREIAKFYVEAFKDISELQMPIEEPWAKNVYWMFNMILKGKLSGKRKEVISKLKEKGVEAREDFVPFNEQEIFIKKGWVTGDECPVANDFSKDGFYIPSGVKISEEELDYVVEKVKEVVKEL